MYRRPMCASVILILCEYCALSYCVRGRPLLNNLGEAARERSDEAYFEEDDLRAMMASNGTSSDSSNNDVRIHKRSGGVMNRIEVQVDEGDGNYTTFNVGVLMASHLDSPFDLERCGPAVDLALEKINKFLLKSHNIKLTKVQAR